MPEDFSDIKASLEQLYGYDHAITDQMADKITAAMEKIKGIKVTYDINLDTYDVSVLKKKIEAQKLDCCNAKGYMVLGHYEVTEDFPERLAEESISE